MFANSSPDMDILWFIFEFLYINIGKKSITVLLKLFVKYCIYTPTIVKLNKSSFLCLSFCYLTKISTKILVLR